jgi:hypothetical protein
MAKKSAAAPAKKKSKKKNKRARASYSVLTTITIRRGNVIDNPDALVVPPKAAAIWIVDNKDTDDHEVSIDPRNITHKKNGRKEHPFTKNAVLTVSVAAGERDVMFALTKGGLVKEGYKYEIESTNGDGTAYKLDPDLDVVDPSSIRF